MVSKLKDTIKEAMDGEVDIDFSGAVSGEFEPLEPGDYDVTVESCKPGESKAGQPKVVFEFKLDDPIDGFTTTLFRHCPTKGKGSGILRDTLRALGFDVDNMTKFDPAEAEGLQATVTVRYQKDNPDYNEITKVKPRAKASRGRATGATKKRARKLT